MKNKYLHTVCISFAALAGEVSQESLGAYGYAYIKAPNREGVRFVLQQHRKSI